MEDNPLHSKARSQSFTTSCGTPECEMLEPFWSSSYSLRNPKGRDLCRNAIQNINKGNGEFYNRFVDHDVVPVKESRTYSDSGTVSLEAGIGDSGKASITTNITKPEDQRSYKDDSTECHSEDDKGLDSSVKFFKNTVQKILDDFGTNMRDIVMYQEKFQEILENHRDESVMETFIKDMVQHILSSEHSATYSQKSTSTYNMMNQNNSSETGMSGSYFPEGKNDKEVLCLPECDSSKETNCFPESKSDIKANSSNNLIKSKNSSLNEYRPHRDMSDDVLNIYFVNGSSHVEIKMNNRQLLSEINIKDDRSSDLVNETASAENISRLAAKKKELEQYFKEEMNHQETDKDIPVKTTHAKKNIHVEGDSLDAENKSFMYKICGYLCKMFRKIN